MKEWIRFLLVCSLLSVVVSQWVNQTQLGTLPLQRTDASFVYSAPQNKFYLFGGRGTTGLSSSYAALNDTYTFTLETTTWAKLNPSGVSVSPRWGQSTVLAADQNSFYIFGGKVDDTSNIFYNETYKYNIVGNSWSLISVGTTRPIARAQHSAVMTAKNTMYIFGGEVFNASQPYRNDLWKLDFNSSTWTMIQDQGPLLPPPSNRPTPRLGHVAALTTSNVMLIYGGADYTGTLVNEIWGYDLTYGNWTKLTPASSNPNARSAVGNAFNFLNNIYIFGGQQQTGPSNDFWSYAVSRVWTQMTNTNAPSARTAPQMAVHSTLNTLVLYGGRSSAYFPEVYTYSISTFHPIQLYYSIEQTGSSTFVYTFKLVQEGTFSGDVDKIVLADHGAGAPSSISPMAFTSPVEIQAPAGFSGGLVAISDASHNGYGYSNGVSAGWTTSTVGNSLTWKIQANNFIPHGRLFWSNEDGSGAQANFVLAIYDCRKVFSSNLDVDGDSYSPCDYYDLKYYDCNDANAAVNPAATEDCNGYDDNCNGFTDTDISIFPLLPVQYGVCAGKNQTCQSGAWAANYSLVPFYESVEATCDGKDNDCDNLIDESLTPPPANNTKGICATATKVCGGASGWLEPNYTALPNYENPEVTCDNLDNNCDGIVNNIVNPPNATKQVGACVGAKQVCINSTWYDDYSTQPNYFNPEGTHCDSIDNDCDGTVDNNLTPPFGSKNTGVCAGYNKTCVSGSWIDFNYTTLPAYEANETKCNNLDDDCDGLIDEYLVGNLTTNQKGVCNGTKQICQAGVWVNNYTVNPQYEVNETKCNNLDDDCDGNVDNNLPPKNSTKVLGVCANHTQTCVNGAWQDFNYSTIPGYQTQETLCDTLDNDCDGNTDSFPANLTSRQGGPCFGLFQKCVNGTGQDDYSSIPYFQWNETLCDGLDNDCDGVNDTFRGTNFTSKQLGVCAGSVKTCKNATWVDDYSYIPFYEPVEVSCDGLDNDCDGQVDNGLIPPLASNQAGVCLGAKKICSNTTFNWVDPNYTTLPYYEVVEVSCDGKDNDCDNRTDYNLFYPADNQQGVCNGCRKVCFGGTYQNNYVNYPNGSITYYEVNEQSCDGLDNDCDGLVDEDLHQLADNQNGVCAGSNKTCAGTAGWQNPDPTTIPGYEAQEVYCDGLDNNCDGKIDNTVSGGCPSNSSSSSGGDASSRGSPVVPGLDYYSNENYNVLGVSMSGTSVVILIFVVIGIGFTCIVSCGWAFFSKKKKRPKRPAFPYGVGPDGMPLPPGLMGEEPEIPMEEYSPTPTGSMPDGSFSRGSTNPSLPIIGRQYG